ncbi:MAG: pirin family protein [bacterium]|nr:pirin family protein [bacterium]
MKIILHKAKDRGSGEHGWLSTRYSFSFASWYEPSRMGFGALRVINDDTIAPENGFGEHGHRDMEIVTIVTQGAVTHADSMGNHAEVKASEVQVMSAGTGVVHAERNGSPDTPLTLFQIWIEPKKLGIAPHYAQKAFDFAKPGETLLVSPDGEGGSLPMNQVAYISQVNLVENELFVYKIRKEGNGLYVFVIEGTVNIENYGLEDRDALGITEASEVKIASTTSARLLLFEVPLQ